MLFKSPLTLAVLVLVCPALLWAQNDLSHRQNDVTVRVVNLAGDPVAGAAVQIEMLDPVFRFGSAITVDQLTPGHANYSAQAIEALQRNFNSTTFGNYMKWGPFESRPVAESQEMVQRALALRAFNSDVGLRLRGHATLWGASYQVPTDFKNMTDRTQMRTRLLDYIRDYHTAFKDTGIITFDLYNEPFHETELIIDRLIDDPDSFTQHASEVAPWFNRAKEADPNAVLYINDYNNTDSKLWK
ncbi:endo-1,4-beta-xylanase [Opitutaceae bacterium]|nr:endo-1,4-beta-xylanase [Opitutaceae bacterium]